MALATLYSPVYATARRGGLRSAGGISTDARTTANIDRGFYPGSTEQRYVKFHRGRDVFAFPASWLTLRDSKIIKDPREVVGQGRYRRTTSRSGVTARVWPPPPPSPLWSR